MTPVIPKHQEPPMMMKSNSLKTPKHSEPNLTYLPQRRRLGRHWEWWSPLFWVSPTVFAQMSWHHSYNNHKVIESISQSQSNCRARGTCRQPWERLQTSLSWTGWGNCWTDRTCRRGWVDAIRRERGRGRPAGGTGRTAPSRWNEDIRWNTGRGHKGQAPCCSNWPWTAHSSRDWRNRALLDGPRRNMKTSWCWVWKYFRECYVYGCLRQEVHLCFWFSKIFLWHSRRVFQIKIQMPNC